MFSKLKKLLESHCIIYLDELSNLLADRNLDIMLNRDFIDTYIWQFRDLKIATLELKISIIQLFIKEK